MMKMGTHYSRGLDNMEIVAFPDSGYIKIETLHMDVDELVNVINNKLMPIPEFPKTGSKIQIREQNVYNNGKKSVGWGIYIPLIEAYTNNRFAELIYELAMRECGGTMYGDNHQNSGQS
jgi:hypothetical protein